MDGKPCHNFRPVKYKAPTMILCQLGKINVNLDQKSCYDGHYDFHGLKASSMIQDGSMRRVHSESL